MGLTKTDVLQHTMLVRYQQWYWSGIHNDGALCIPETFISGYSHTHDIHTTPLESLNTEYKLPVYMSVWDWKGGFTRTEVKDSKNLKKFCCKGTVSVTK